MALEDQAHQVHTLFGALYSVQGFRSVVLCHPGGDGEDVRERLRHQPVLVARHGPSGQDRHEQASLQLVGNVANRDIDFFEDREAAISAVMTFFKIVYASKRKSGVDSTKAATAAATCSSTAAC